MAKKRYLIIGDGAAGMTAAQTLRAADRNARIAIMSDDPHPGYFRAALTNYLLGELREDQLWAVPPDFYDSARVSRVFCRVVALDGQNSQVWEASGSTPIPYDALLIASGARPRAAEFPGAHLRGVHTMRTIMDVRHIAELLSYGSVKSAVVLGGGPLGLEWAHGLHERGVKVQLLERSPRLMGNVLDEVCSDLLAARLRSAGIEVSFGQEVVNAYPNQQGGVGAVSTQTGLVVSCDLVAAAFGVEPNSEFLVNSGVTLDERRRVVTNAAMQTSIPNVWAAGDVASVNGQCFGLWEPAKRQASVAARNMLGGQEQFVLAPHYMATRLFDLDFASVGRVDAPQGSEVLVDFPEGTGSISYRKLVFHEGRLIGAQMLGQRATRVRRSGRALGRLIASGVDATSIKSKLLTAEFDVLGWLGRQRLFQRPARGKRQRKLVNIARLKGTQALNLGSIAAAKAEVEKRQATQLVSSRQTRMLSIGLHAEAAPPAAMASAPLDARLQFQGKEWPLSQHVVRLGSATDAEFRLPGVGSLHAEIRRQGRKLFLRDAGSRSGTRVNGERVTVPHALVDGDQIQIENHILVLRSTELAPAPRQVQGSANSLGLLVQTGQSIGLSFALGQAPVLIGSAEHCQLRLPEPSVAREHARVSPHQGRYYIADLGSPAGTRIAGSLLSPHQNQPLSDNMVFAVGAVEILYGLRPEATTLFFESKAHVVVDQGAERGQTFTLGARSVVGSAPHCQIRLSGLSPQHAEIGRQGLDYFVRDLSNSSRSFCSGTPLGPMFHRMNSGDVLLLGDVMLRFEED